MQHAQQSFIKGVAILSLAAFLSKLLGAVYRVPYQNITGDSGMFVYGTIYPLYSAILIIATAGFPVAISKLVSERLAQGNKQEAERIFEIALLMMGFIGGTLFFSTFIGAPTIASWMGSKALLTIPIQAVSFSFLVIPIISAVRGYFQGYQNMIPTAVSQVVEQLVRVTIILLAAWVCMTHGFGVVYAGAGAMMGAFGGGLVALLVLYAYWSREKMILKQSDLMPMQKVKNRRILYAIFKIALPISLGSLVIPFYALVDSFTIINTLTHTGWMMEEVIQIKGIYDRGQPLLQFASFFATAIALSIVPAIASTLAHNQTYQSQAKGILALRLTLLFGFPASIGLAVVMEPINIMLFKDSAGSSALAILALTTIFSTLGITSTAILQGLGFVTRPVWNLMIGVFFKVGLNLLLIPVWGIHGAAVASICGYAIAIWLNLRILRRNFAISLPIQIWLKNSIAVAVMAISVYSVSLLLQMITRNIGFIRLEMTIVVLGCVVIGSFVYLLAVVRIGLLTRIDFEKIPKLKEKILPFLDKWGMISK
ncbi:polysaccharide biosynthesis protein [Hazenella sp. IB182357]|uniref:Polysaccharide biosynthesis protein n=1 Tax=Polycladospora coralii TaxID=2771432 RepID=A0A926N9W3_9BACL|nr:polysaccharide biosynthesis protein [Polycladospora coralii]MBD1372458.1 polysaccharide biosynthesis protein [Polycladospora coralii]MBS7531780.1 polysaccharide biosynthesis protein [Polycladospora coralii]